MSRFFAGFVDRLTSWRQLAAFLPLVLVVLCVIGGAAHAQDLSPTERSELEARKATLFQQMLRDPGNLDTAFTYADVSAKLGDNEAAVSALERMLLFNPNLPRVQLELGALYFRMGSYEVSRTYFEKALQANPPEDVRARIDTYLGQIARLSGTQQFSGFFFTGAQYQSDANIGPGSPLIHSPIGDVLLNSQFVKKRDENIFATGSLLYSYDLGTQERDVFEVLGTGFANHYGTVTRLDLGLVELTGGPRFNFTEPLPWMSAASLKPYAILNDVSLGGNQYFHTFGVGGEGTALVWQDLRLKSVFEFRQKDFDNAPDRPTSTDLNGNDKLVSLFMTKPITKAPLSELNLEFDFLDQDTKALKFTNKSYAVAAAYRVRYDDPVGLLKYPWETTAFLSRSWAYYAAPDTCCRTGGTFLFPTFSPRFDRHWRFGLTQSFQVANNIAIVLQAQRDVVSSNLSLYAYTSNSVLIGPQFRF